MENARSWFRAALFAALSMAIGVLGFFAVAEIVLRLLPITSGLKALSVDAHNPVLRYTPNRRFTWSSGWNFAVVNRGRTNNYGFINDQDYDSTLHTPLLAVVGDSYVEAFMVPYQATLQGRLARVVGTRGRVYSFGMSGGALTQYLAEAEFAKAMLRPNGLAVVIVGNDFDESLMKKTGFHYFEQDAHGLRLARVDYAAHPFPWVMWSAVARYWSFNLKPAQAIAMLRAWIRKPTGGSPWVGNTAAAVDSQRLIDSRRVVDEFLAELPWRSGLDPARIVLLVDGMRPNLYRAEGLQAAAGSYFDLMRRYLIAAAARGGFEVIDMQPRFIARYRRDSLRFESPNDSHWNALGHEAATEAVAGSAVFRRTFPWLGGSRDWPRCCTVATSPGSRPVRRGPVPP